jgi:hypothetical protein
MTTPYRGSGVKGKVYEQTITAQQYTRTPKDGSAKSGVVWDALQAAKKMPPGPKRQKAIDRLVLAYGAETYAEDKARERANKAYFKREKEREIKTYNRDRKK